MTLPASGAISLNEVNVELGNPGTTQISMNDAAVRTLFGIPSGAIDMDSGHGKANQFAFSITSNTTNANLATLATAAGWPGASKLVATINPGVYITSNSTGTAALTVSGSFPGGVELTNNGIIVGRGGNGGTGQRSAGSSGGGGGPALSVSSAITITNNGTIAGGGGGGGGGGGVRAGNGPSAWLSGGGGGGGRSSLSNSSGGGVSPENFIYEWGRQPPTQTRTPGGGGTVNTNGGGGTYSYLRNFYSPGYLRSGAGGSGGGWGASGSSGGSGAISGFSGAAYSGGGGGSAGSAVSGNPNITWIATGTRYGGIS